jgi:hypothetical protein
MRIVRKHRGHLSVRSEPGSTCFLPLDQLLAYFFRPLSIDPATKYCLGSPSFSAFFAEKDGASMSLFSRRIYRPYRAQKTAGRESCSCRQSSTLAHGLVRLSSLCGRPLYGSTSTPRQKATKPLILRAAGLGSG